LDPALPANRIRDLVAGRAETDVVRALHATIRNRPGDVVAFFVKCLGREVRQRSVAPTAPAFAPLKSSDDPYA
ncbi:MAG: hypothetical protein R2882_14235, partial [Gemmatimonadales bacterium]